MKSTVIRVGSRESQLARLQTDVVIRRLAQKFPDRAFEVVAIRTQGDKVLDKPIAEIGGQGVFVKELERALSEREVDFVVHSLKDLPTTLPPDLVLAAALDREDPRDVVVSNGGLRLAQLPASCRLATSSRRRIAQLSALRRDLTFVDMRGNIPTRLRKLEEGQCDAMILAGAGLHRLGVSARIAEYLPVASCTPAAGQAALGVECRLDNEAIRSMLATIEEQHVRRAVDCERLFLDKLGGGCSVPIGALAEETSPGTIRLTGCIAALDGSTIVRDAVELESERVLELVEVLIGKMLSSGGAQILEQLRNSSPANVSAP